MALIGGGRGAAALLTGERTGDGPLLFDLGVVGGIGAGFCGLVTTGLRRRDGSAGGLWLGETSTTTGRATRLARGPFATSSCVNKTIHIYVTTCLGH